MSNKKIKLQEAISIDIGGMVILFAYEVLKLIANASPDIVNPKINIL